MLFSREAFCDTTGGTYGTVWALQPVRDWTGSCGFGVLQEVQKAPENARRRIAQELMRLVDVAATTLLACIHNSSKSTAICCVTAGALILSITTKKFASCSIEVLLFVSYCAILRNIKYQQQSSLIMSHLPLHVPYMTIQEGDITCNPLTTCDCT